MTQEATSKGTRYVVLRETDAGLWENVGATVATSSDAALRITAKETGSYVAVPARSFTQTQVTVESVTRLKLS